MKSVKFLIIVVLVVLSVNSARSEFKTLVKDGEKVKCSVPAPMTEKGRVKWYNENKGYGYIQRDGGKDVFFHSTSIVDSEKLDLSKLEGREVEFEVVESPKGPIAANVRIIN